MVNGVVDREIDVGIITIVPTEIEALFETLAISREAYETGASPFQYWRTTYRSDSSGRSVSIVVSFLVGDAGNTEAAIAVTHFVRDWYPRIMCLVGITAGLKGKTRIGDVILPNKIHDRTIKVFEQGKYRVRGNSYTRNEIVDRMLKVSPLSTQVFLDAFSRAAGSDIHQATTIALSKNLGVDTFNGHPRILDGSIASDNVLIKDPSYFDGMLDATDEKCRGGEMEAAGFVLACLRERNDFPWLVIRGISDFGDSTKDDSFQLFAAKAACTALRLIIENSLTIDALPTNPRVLRSRSAIEFNIVRQVREAFDRKRWLEVCRSGTVLSRSLWLSGHLELRYEIGLLVENAAAFSNNAQLRARVLIDDLGWTAYRLGNEQKGEKHIRDGIRLARECEDYYIIAKGYRHLASLQRRGGDPQRAETLLGEAQTNAERIGDIEEKSEMLATLKVSRAKLLFVRGFYGEAENLLRTALQDFIDSGDAEREVKVYAQLAQCSEKLNDKPQAEFYYIAGRRKAFEAGRFDEIAENTRGLIHLLEIREPARSKALAREVYEFASSNGLWDEARKWYEECRLSDDL